MRKVRFNIVELNLTYPHWIRIIGSPMASIKLLFLSFALLVGAIPANHAKDSEPFKLGKCNPVGAVRTLNSELEKGKSVNDSFTVVLRSNQFDGSNACITFIREASMELRESAPHTFKTLWLE